MMTALNVLKVIVPVTMIAHTTKLFNRELGEMEGRHWSLKGASERERNRVFGNAGTATRSLTTVCTLVSHTPASDRRERVLLHEKFILHRFRAISTPPPPRIPHLVDPRHIKMSKWPSVYGVPVRGTPYASDARPSSASASDSHLPSAPAPATSSLFHNAFGRMTSYATRSRSHDVA